MISVGFQAIIVSSNFLVSIRNIDWFVALLEKDIRLIPHRCKSEDWLHI